MAAYVTRVELHNASYTDYENLHSAMASQGFDRTITSSQGIKYHLPTAEYYRTTPLALEQVLESAKMAASKTKKSNAVIVTEANRVSWDGLPIT